MNGTVSVGALCKFNLTVQVSRILEKDYNCESKTQEVCENQITCHLKSKDMNEIKVKLII